MNGFSVCKGQVNACFPAVRQEMKLFRNAFQKAPVYASQRNK